MKTNEEMNMKPVELAHEQLEQVTGGAADGARCVNGLNKIKASVCENCENYTCSDDGVKYCAIGVRSIAKLTSQNEFSLEK